MRRPPAPTAARRPSPTAGPTRRSTTTPARTRAWPTIPTRPTARARARGPTAASSRSDGIRLAGWYVPAGNGIGPEGPTVILAHGYEGNKSTMLAHAALLHDEYNLVLFDFRNHGQSSGEVTTQGALEQNDVREVVDWLDRRKGPQQIALTGRLDGRRRGAGRVDRRRPDRRGHPGLDPRHRGRGHPGAPGRERLPARRCPAPGRPCSGR